MWHYYLKAQARTLSHHLLPQCIVQVIALTVRRGGEILLGKYASFSPSRMRFAHYRVMFRLSFLPVT